MWEEGNEGGKVILPVADLRRKLKKDKKLFKMYSTSVK